LNFYRQLTNFYFFIIDNIVRLSVNYIDGPTFPQISKLSLVS